MTLLLPILAIVTGGVIGSFLALIAVRWPRGESIVTGRSRCEACGRQLTAAELIPVLSFIVQKGRCRACHAALPIDLLVAELLGSATALLALDGADSPAGFAALALFGWTLLLLGLLDARHYWLPDRLTLSLIACGLASYPVLPSHDLIERLVGAGVGFLSFSAIRWGYRALRGREGMGGGDAKLMAAIGAWLGIACLPLIVLGAALLGILWAIARNALQREPLAEMRIPLGTALAIAATLAIPFAA